MRPLAMATCDLDVGILHGAFLARGPFALGHECVAEVIETGAGVTVARAGDRVVVPFQISCGVCKRCLGGLKGNCTTAPFRSSYGLGPFGGHEWGVFADLVRVPFADAMLMALPEGIDPVAVASASDNLPDAWRAVGPYAGAGASVLVTDGRYCSIGLYAAGMAVALGAAHVDYADTDTARLAIAERLSATAVPVPASGRLGATRTAWTRPATRPGCVSPCRRSSRARPA